MDETLPGSRRSLEPGDRTHAGLHANPQAAATILAAMPPGDEKREVLLHYLYALRTVQTGWTPELQQQLGAAFSGPHGGAGASAMR